MQSREAANLNDRVVKVERSARVFPWKERELLQSFSVGRWAGQRGGALEGLTETGFCGSRQVLGLRTLSLSQRTDISFRIRERPIF